MKAILISDHAKWCAKMMNGEKTIEVRSGTALYKAIKKLIDEYGYADIYVYCTKSSLKVNGKYGYKKELVVNGNVVNGKVPFKFRCYNVEEINKYPSYNKISGFYYTPNLSWDKLEKVSCLSFDEINDYLKGKTSTAIHISNLEIFDKPKELREFDRCILTEDLSHDNIIHIHQRFKITKAPQSYCYIEVGE